MNAGVIFLPCVAYCFILLRFTPPPSPLSQPSRGPQEPCSLGTPGDTRCRGDVEGTQRQAGQMLPTHSVAISTGSPADTLAADAAAFWDMVIRALPAHTEPPVLPWPHVPSHALSLPPPQGSARRCPRVHFASPGVAGLQPAASTAEQIPAVQRHRMVGAGQWCEQL